jgi:YD repeat-containing protein
VEEFLALLPPGVITTTSESLRAGAEDTVLLPKGASGVLLLDNRMAIVPGERSFDEDVRLIVRRFNDGPEPVRQWISSVVIRDQDALPLSGVSVSPLVTGDVATDTLGILDPQWVDPAAVVTSTFGIDPKPVSIQDSPFYVSIQAVSVATGKPIEKFDQPVMLAFDLRGVPGFERTNRWAVVYQDADNPAIWHPVVLSTLDEKGVVSVDTTHFSDWSAYTEPGAWHYRWNAPTISTFSGAAMYSYPVQVPPGRNGLQPSIDLSYSSSGLDGHLGGVNLDQGPLALGWNIPNIEITRDDPYHYSSGAVYLYHNDRFQLVMNGTGYELVMGAGQDVLTSTVRYYAKNGPDLQVWRIYDAADTQTNPDRFYWYVKTGDGTEYRLGYTPDSESGQIRDYGLVTVAGHTGYPGAGVYSGIRWRVDTVTDTYGNQIQYTYAVANDQVDSYTGNSGPISTYTDMRRIAEIRYNFQSLATFNGHWSRVGGNYAARIVFTPFSLDASSVNFLRLDRIDIYHLDLATPIRTIQFDRVTFGANTCGAGNEHALITAITEKNGTTVLPATTFTYYSSLGSGNADIEAKYHHGSGSCFPYAYMRTVSNGYGATTKFIYGNDGREGWYSGERVYGRSYFVTEAQTQANAGGPWTKTLYLYDTPCFDISEPYGWGNLAGAFDCGLVYRPRVGTMKYYGSLVGFNRTDVIAYDYGGATPLSRTVHWYYQDVDRLGQEFLSQQLNPAPQAVSLPNYGGENGTAGWFEYDPSAVQSVGVDSNRANAQSGAASIQIGVTNAGLDHWVGYTIGGVTAGTYWVTWSAKGSNAGSRMGVAWYSSTNPGEFARYTGDFQMAPWYRHFSTPITVPAGTNQITLFFRTYDNGTYWIDDVSFSPVAHMQRTAYVTQTPGGSPVSFTRPSISLDYTMDGDRGAIFGPRTDYAYDDFGNLTQQTDYFLNNLTSFSGGKFYLAAMWLWTAKTRTYYSYNGINAGTTHTADWITNKLKRTETFVCGDANCSYNGAQQAESRYHYGYASPWDGLITRGYTLNVERAWVRGGVSAQEFLDVRYAYDGFGNRVNSYTYENYGSSATVASTNGRVTQYVYDPTWNLYVVTVTPPKTSLTVQIKYYGIQTALTATGAYAGQISGITDPNGQEIKYEYDKLGRLSKVIKPGDSSSWPTVQYEYSDTANLFPLRVTATYQEIAGSASERRPIIELYDGLGQLIQTRAERTNGGLQSVVDYVYDGLGRTTTEFVPYDETFAWGYTHASGWDTRAKTTTAYDWLSRPTRVTMPNGNYEDHAYAIDHGGFFGIWPASPTGMYLHRVVDQNSHLRDEISDPFGRIVRVREYKGWCWPNPTTCTGTNAFTEYSTTKYTYDWAGRLITVEDALGAVTSSIAYDAGGRKTSMTDSDMGAWSYTYQPGTSLLQTQTDARGCVVTLSYDTMDRLTHKTYNGPGACATTPGVVYRYDEAVANGQGRRTSMVDGTGTTSWTFTARGLVETETRNLSGIVGAFQTQYWYDSMNRVTEIKYPRTQERVVQAHNNEGQLYSVQSKASDPNSFGGYYYVSAMGYDAAERVVSLSLGGGALNTTFAYYPWAQANKGGRLQYIQAIRTGDNTTAQYLLYDYDKNGNVTYTYDSTNGGQTLNYEYDELDRLTRAYSTGGGSWPFNTYYYYNEIGNITNVSGAPISGAYTHNAFDGSGGRHAVDSVTFGGTTYAAYAYDQNGNATTRNVSGQAGQTLTYDAENRLVQSVTGYANVTFS